MKREKNKLYIIFILIITLIAIICSIHYARSNTGLLDINKETIENINFITLQSVLISIGIISVSVLFSFIGVGILILLFYYIYEFFISGFIITTIILNFSLSGTVSSLLYFVIYKLITLVLLIVVTKLYIYNFKQILSKVILKKDINTKIIIRNTKKIIIYIILIILNNVIIFLIDNIVSKLIINLI